MTGAPVLPPGVHPGDPSTDPLSAVIDANRAAPLDAPHAGHPRGRAPWAVGNEDALATFQRLGSTWATGMVVVTTGNPTARIVQRQRGRSSLRLWVPGSVIIGGVVTTPTPAGVMFGSDEGELQVAAAGGSPLNVGDLPVDIPSEGGVWAGLLPGQAAGYVCYLHCWSPAGGGLDY